jgi:hypothetical protein
MPTELRKYAAPGTFPRTTPGSRIAPDSWLRICVVSPPRTEGTPAGKSKEVSTLTATELSRTTPASTAERVSQAAAQVSTLVRDELALAKLELAEKGKRAGVAGGLFGGAAVLAAYGMGLLLTLAVVLLDVVWPLWLAVLVVMAGRSSSRRLR